MKILVCGCDKNQDLFDIFHHCIEKYYPEHPEILYSTETIENPYYKTICKNYPLEKWTKRIRETLKEIDDDAILLLMDDIFIRGPVDTKRIDYAKNLLGGNIALVNLEKEWDKINEDVGLDRFKRRTYGMFRISLMCGIWDRLKLIDILDEDSDPWTVENAQRTKGYDYYINSGENIIDFGYKTFENCAIMNGKWCREVIPFFEKEGIQVDYSIRGFKD